MDEKIKTNDFEKSVFIIGGTGFLGENIVRYFNQKGYKITSISLPNERQKQVLEDEPNVKHILKDFNDISDSEMVRYMNGHKYMVIALGTDELKSTTYSSLDFFRKYYLHNTTNLLRLASLSNIRKTVVLGSYYSYFDRVWPEEKLSEYHPYIKSRVEQKVASLRYNSSGFEVVLLEIPYVFGTIPEKSPIKSMLDNEIKNKKCVYYPKGGTAAITQYQIAQAVEGAFLYGEGGKAYPIAGTNIKWKAFLAHLLSLQGRDLDILKPVSKWRQSRELKKRMKLLKKFQMDTGINLSRFARFQDKKAYINPKECMNELKIENDDIKNAVRKTLFVYNLKLRALSGKRNKIILERKR